MLFSGDPRTTFIQYLCPWYVFRNPRKYYFARYADDNTPYTHFSKIEHVLTNLQGASDKLFHWFSENHLVANARQRHLLSSSNLLVDIPIANTKISNVERGKLLGVNFQDRLNFDYHVNILLKKASKKYHTLARIWNCMDTKKRRVLMNTFITSQFSYCPLVWVFHGRTLNNRITKIPEKALRIVYKDENISLFWWLIEKEQISENSPKEATNPCDRDL